MEFGRKKCRKKKSIFNQIILSKQVILDVDLCLHLIYKLWSSDQQENVHRNFTKCHRYYCPESKSIDRDWWEVRNA